MVRIGSGALLALALAGCAPRPESSPMVNDPVPVVWTTLRQADARDLLVEAGNRDMKQGHTLFPRRRPPGCATASRLMPAGRVRGRPARP